MSLLKEKCISKTNKFITQQLALLNQSKNVSRANQARDMRAGWTLKSKEEWDAELQAFDTLTERLAYIPEWDIVAPHKRPEKILEMLVTFKNEFMLEEVNNTKRFLKLIVDKIEENAKALDEKINPCRNLGPNPFAIRRTPNNHNL